MITIEQIRAARALKGWGQVELAERTGLTQVTVASIESGKSKGSPASMQAITTAFQNAGVEFIEGGVRFNTNFINLLTEKDSYLSLLDDVFFTLRDSGGEVLFFGSDERRSTDAVNKKLVQLRKANIKMRSLISEGNTYLLGPLEEYRYVPTELATTDVSVIYTDKVAFILDNKPHYQVLLLKNQYVSNDHKRTFDYFWGRGEKPNHTTAEISYDQI